MSNPDLKHIADAAPTLADLKKLSREKQSLLLLARLNAIYPQMPGGLHKGNLNLPGYGLTAGYCENEGSYIRQYLLGTPWTELVNRGYIVDTGGQGFYSISDDGKNALTDTPHITVSHAALEATGLLHPALGPSQQDFREGRFKVSVATAFQLVENRLNQVRDASSNPDVVGKAGVNLPHTLFESGVLKLPFPNLGANDKQRCAAYVHALRNLLSGAIGFIRNAFEHEQHNLPDLDEKSALELLFFASYLLRTIEESSK